MFMKNRRRYIHHCPEGNNREAYLTVEICPKCGQAGKFDGWRFSVTEYMCFYVGKTSIPPMGIQHRFLPQITKNCEHCNGRGYFLNEKVDEDDQSCPYCSNGEIIILEKDQLAKVQKWAKRRHNRLRNEDEHEWAKREPPSPAFFTRNIDAAVHNIMAMVDDGKKNGKRNQIIGNLMLKADDSAWDFCMEMIEKWERIGGGLIVRGNRIALSLSDTDPFTVAWIDPGAGNSSGAIILLWDGFAKIGALSEEIKAYHQSINSAAQGVKRARCRIFNLDQKFGLTEAWIFLRALRTVCRM